MKAPLDTQWPPGIEAPFRLGALRRLNEASRRATLRRFEWLAEFLFAAPVAKPHEAAHLFAALEVLAEREPGADG